MPFFRENAAAVRERVAAGEFLPVAPGWTRTLALGSLGGVALSVAGFVPWAVFGRPLHRALGEAGLYAVCAVVFVATSGLALHRLLVGKESLARFYKLFAASFPLYAIAWTAAWMLVGGHAGSVLGLLGAAVAMAAVLAGIFGSWRVLWAMTGALFLPVAAGYFAGGIAEGAAMRAADSPGERMAAMLLWGVFFGLGFGTGLAVALRWAQQDVFRQVNAPAVTGSNPR